uniref:ATP-dependent DNA helicase n=1 Tax=Strongyloides papillosus TaxID=174720 RepID=A0A0N5B2M0_STREA
MDTDMSDGNSTPDTIFEDNTHINIQPNEETNQDSRTPSTMTAAFTQNTDDHPPNVKRQRLTNFTDNLNDYKNNENNALIDEDYLYNSDGYCEADTEIPADIRNNEHVNLTASNFDFNNILFRDIGISQNEQQQNNILASDNIFTEVNNTDLSDAEEQIDTMIDTINQLESKNIKMKKRKKILKLPTDEIKLDSQLRGLTRFRDANYKLVWPNTLKLASQLGMNFITDKVIRFNSTDTDYDENDIEYCRRLVGGYKYHFYQYGSDVKGFYSFNKVFTVAFHIFHSTEQYDETKNYKFDDYLKELSDKQEETKKQEDLRYRISKNLFTSLYENKALRGDIQPTNTLITNTENGNITTFDPISKNREMIRELENGYNFDASERDPIENVYYNVGSLARICDSNCKLMTFEFIENLFTIIIAFQHPTNKVRTLFSIRKYIMNINFMEDLTNYMHCYSRLRGFHRRLTEILSQMEWIEQVNRRYNDSSLNDYSKFNITLRRQLVTQSYTHSSNEINFLHNMDAIIRLRNDYRKFDFSICTLCEWLLNNEQISRLQNKGEVYNRLRRFFPLSQVNGIPVNSLQQHLRKTQPDHRNLLNNYSCDSCSNFARKTKKEYPNPPPKASLVNMLYFDVVPDELKNLNYIEKLLISKTWCVQSIISITKIIGKHSNIRAVKGYAICFAIDNIKSFVEMTKPGTRKIIVQNTTKAGFKYNNLVDVMKIYKALKWLKEHNEFYSSDLLPDMTNISEKTSFCSHIENQFIFHNDIKTTGGNVILEHVGYIKEQDYIPYIFQDGTSSGVKGDIAALFDLKYARDFRHTVEERITKITPAYYLKCVCRRADRKAVKDPQFVFALEKTEQEQEGYRNIQTSLRFKGGKAFRKEDLGFLANRGKLLSAFSSNRLSDAYWKKITNKLMVIETFIEPATWFMTLNPAPTDWPEVTDLYRKYYDPDYGAPFKLDNEIAKDPFIFNQFFRKRVKLLLNELCDNPSILGTVVYYYYKIQYQQRGPPHCHFLLWTEDGMNLDLSNDGAIREFLDKYVTCSLYKNNEELHNIVKKFQTHTCLSMYCLKTKLKPIPPHKLKTPPSELKKRDKTYKFVKCRFGYPKKPRSETTIFRMNASLEAIMEISNRPQKAYELRRDVGEENINPYNPTIAMIFQSNTDLTFNGLQITAAGALNYAAKYVSKSTLSNNEEINKLMRELAFSKDNDISTMLFKLAYSLHLRPQPYTEVIDAAIGNKTHDTSINVYYCTTETIENRTRMTAALRDKNGEIVGLETKENIYDNYYINRPTVLEKSCLFQILANFICTSIDKIKASAKFDIIDFEQSFESQSHIIQTDEEIEERNIYYFITKNSNKRHISSPCFQHNSKIYYPIKNYEVCLSPVKMRLLNFFHGLKILESNTEEDDEEDLYRRYCLLFVPYRSELYSESSKVRFTNYMTNLKQTHPESVKDIEILINCANSYIKKQVLQNDFREYKKETEKRLRQLLNEEGGNVEELGVYEDDDIDLLKDVKNTDEIINNICSLNVQQRRIFDRIYDSISNEITNKSPERCRILVDGPGGTGKSYLIKSISEAVTYLCRTSLNDLERTYPNVLLCGPTGMSANQIKGKTAHTLFGIPCNANFRYIRYTELSSGKLTKLSESLKHVKLLIMDEISMIPNEILYMINLRLNEAKHSVNRLFGDINVLMLGDMMQLPPVSNHSNRPMFYKEIDIGKFNKMFGPTLGTRSAFINFEFIPLTENVRQQNDPDFGDVLNSIRMGGITDKARYLLNERITDKTLFETYLECENNYGDCVIISPNNKTVDETNEHIIRSIAAEKNYTVYEISCKDSLAVKNKLNRRIYLKKEAKYSREAITDISLQELESCLTVFEKKSNRKEKGLPTTLYICNSSRVMLTRNKNVRKGLCNGARGHVVGFKHTSNIGNSTKLSALDLTGITIKFDNCDELVDIKPSHHRYVEGKILIKRIQFPLQICYSMTVHKCQGLTLPSAIINFPSSKHEKINETPGLLYVALSRVRTSNSLFIYELNYDRYNNANMENKEQIEKMQRQIGMNTTEEISKQIVNSHITSDNELYDDEYENLY